MRFLQVLGTQWVEFHLIAGARDKNACVSCCARQGSCVLFAFSEKIKPEDLKSLFSFNQQNPVLWNQSHPQYGNVFKKSKRRIRKVTSRTSMRRKVNRSLEMASSANEKGVIPSQIIQTVKPRCQGFASRLHHSEVLMK